MRLRVLTAVVVALAMTGAMHAGEVARGDLAIIGLGLEVDRNPVQAATGVPSFVQTKFGGVMNDEAPIVPGLSALGELIGPGINVPLTLSAIPGKKFALPALHEKGEYTLQNIRLVGANGEFLQPAVPSFAQITVADALSTKVRVRQLTPEELRERGITIDARNFEVYEYTFVFSVDGSEVLIPYTVLVDKKNRVIHPLGPQGQSPPPLPRNGPRPRFSWSPPTLFDLGPGPAFEEQGGNDREPTIPRPRLPAALVVPTGFGVLHQFFAVILDVSNSSEQGSNVRIDSITATLNAPQQMRVSKVMPAVSIGQPVPITDEQTGATFLVAGARGSAEWTLEALKTGTHTIGLDIRATYQKPGQDDFPMTGHAQTSIVVSDPRFQVNFSHPDTVRKNDPYTAYAFVTNLSEQLQHVLLDTSEIPPCTTGGSIENICRVTDGSDADDGTIELDLQPGQMTSVPYKLSSKATGRVFAAAGSANDETVGVSVRLSMGVSASGIPLSPATLLMPHYAQWVPQPIVDANLQLFGLGYSLATAPLNKFTAAHPRIIRSDVFTRAQEIARAGQRIFNVPTEQRDALIHLSLDLLDNVERVDHLSRTPPLTEWDQLRRQEASGRQAAAAMARELERVTSADEFVDAFAAATSHRSPFLFAYVEGEGALSVTGRTSGAMVDVAAEAANSWIRTLPTAELTQLTINGEPGQLALVGRWTDNLRVTVKPTATSFTLHLLYPDLTDGRMLRADFDVANATPGTPVIVDLQRGARTLIVQNAIATPLVNDVPQSPIRVLGAAQDLYLDAAGHVVTMLFNRPVTIAESQKWRDRIALIINVPKASYTAIRRNNPSDPNAELQIPGAIAQEDGRLLAISFDKTLSRNATYEIAIEDVLDLLDTSRAPFAESHIVPRIDNDRPGAILTGRVLLADNTPVTNTLVSLSMPDVVVRGEIPGAFEGLDQVDISDSDGRFLFEYVPRDLDRGLFGQYDLRARLANGRVTELSGAVRRPGEVHTVNLVFAGRGRVQGHVRYDDGEPIANRLVTASSPLHNGEFSDVTDANGFYEMEVGVGPLTFFVVDRDGRTTFATNQLRTAGEQITQDLIVLRQKPGGFGTVRVQVRRADTNELLAGATVSVLVDGYTYSEQRTGNDGSVTIGNIPAGIITVFADHSGFGALVEIDLRADQTVDQTIVLDIRTTAPEFATLTGTVTRDDPAAPNDTSKDVAVAGAMIVIKRFGTFTANNDGTFTIPDIPTLFSGEQIMVFDPTTGRKGWFRVPTLIANTPNHVPLRLSTTSPGLATMRVRLYGAQGEPVSGFEVLSPGYPPQKFSERSAGVYEVQNVRVPRNEGIIAIAPNANGPYGDQYASGHVRVDFDGQIGVTDVRLPGAGTINVRLEVEQTCSTPPCYAQALGPASITYGFWDVFLQNQSTKTVTAEPDPVTGIVTFPKVPARQWITVETVRHPLGHAAQQVFLAYDGDARNVTLRLKDIGDVTGRVFAHDNITPIANAAIRIVTNNAVYSAQLSKPDGSFRFPAIPANLAFEVIAELSQDGIYRTGIAYGRTPEGGGPVSNLRIVMREQSSIEGRVLDANGIAVPLARYWMRELVWPHRNIGTPADPLQADINGRFVLGNVFTGPFRITAVAPDNQELRGDYQGTLAEEGDTSQRSVEVRIGQAGVGSISVTVLDPLLGFEPVANAEVGLLRGASSFDFTSANENGVAFFEQVPAGTYRVTGYSKARVRGGTSNDFTVVAGQTTSVSVQLEFRGAVSGYVTDPDSEPVPHARVPALPVTISGQNYQMRDSTDANGAFELVGTPEGSFQISGYEIGTERIAFGPTNLFISRLVPEHRDLHLQLERFAKLTVKVYLPNDAGGPGELVPLAEVDACQCAPQYGDFQYLRVFQGNPVAFDRMIHRRGYKLTVREIGGEGRVIIVHGGFPPGVYQHEQIVVLPASGTAEVMVRDGSGNPVGDALVAFYAPGRIYELFTPPSGLVTITNVPFGNLSAIAKKGVVTAAGSTVLASRTLPARIDLNLGTNISVSGFVDAETPPATPSIGTRVVLNVASRLGNVRLETRTGADGSYSFAGVPVGDTTLSFLYYSEADTFLAASQVIPIANGTTGNVIIPRVRLDATPPRIVSIDPPPNSTNVSPVMQLSVTFSEQILAHDLDPFYFQLVSSDDGTRMNVSLQSSVRPDGTFIVKVIPASQLASNVLYRFSVAPGMHDLTGHAVQLGAGTSFTTVNYTEPSIVRVEPSENDALVDGQLFRIKFNKPIDLASFDAGNGGIVTLDRLATYKGASVQAIPITRALDALDPSTLVIAPVGVAIAEASFYRLTIAGVRDTSTPPNVQRDTRIVEYFSFDRVKPVVRIVSPVASAEKLVTGVLYGATAVVTNEGTTDEAGDIAYIDWLDEAGVSIARAKTKPFTYSFVAPANVTSFTLKASATDLSFNTGNTASMRWEVVPNAAPRDVTVTNTPASAYPDGRVETRVHFNDEGLVVTVALSIENQVIASRNITRLSTTEPFTDAVFQWNVPLSLANGPARVVATVTDSVNKTTTAEQTLTILADTLAPHILTFTPAAESRFQFGVNGSYEIAVAARDNESGVARATFTVNGTEVFNGPGTLDTTTGVRTFRRTVTVPPKNADTRIPIVVRVYDHRDNVLTETRDVIYERVDDATLPVAAWLTPLDGAALPSNLSSWSTKLRIRATDDVLITSVRFESTALAAPITLTTPKNGTTDIFETSAILTMPQDGAPFVIRAFIADGNPAHDVELPITIDPVAVAPVINADINISSLTADQYANKSIAIRGARVYVTVPLTFKDLILLDGAVLSNPEETKLDLTITDRLFVDGDSRIDVAGKGFLGGLRTREDNSFTNPSRSGRTLSGPGATNADGSHAGIGGSSFGATNATYGSITDPHDFGSGGSAQPATTRAGANGGGAVVLRGSRFVIAGAIRADAGPRSNGFDWGAGAGGSVNLNARTLITSPLTRITANGGDQDASLEVDRGGGGGRIAIRAADRLDLDPLEPVLQARGGRNGSSAGPQYVDGGAGTIVVNDSLFVSSAGSHSAAGTPLAGTLDFDTITIGPRTLARFDNAFTGTLIADPTALVLTPTDVPTLTVWSAAAAAAALPRGGAIQTHWTAASIAGVREVRVILDAQPNDVVTYPHFATTIPETTSTISVPATSNIGNATLKLRVSDRSGRVTESAPIAINIIENTPPVIDTFTVTPPVEMHAGHNIVVTATASDDVAVTSLALTSTVGTVNNFTVTVPPTTPANTDVVLTLSASDSFPSRAPTTRTHTVRILPDTIAPSMTVLAPTPNVHLQEGTGATFLVEVTAADAEVAIERVVVTLDGVEHRLAFITANTYRTTLNVPNVDGTDPVAKTLTITALDYAGNSTTNDIPLFVDPLIDPNAPTLQWICASPGTMAPPGYELAFRVSAIPSSPANGVSNVTVNINGTPIAAISVGTDLYEAKYTIPAGTADGTTFDVMVTARSVAGNESTLAGSITGVTGTEIATTSVIAADDLAFENQSVIVRAGGVLTITGAHTLRNLVVLSGGRLLQQHADLARGDLLSATRISIGCGAIVDVTGLGFTKMQSAPGAGVADDLSGGSHIGHGSQWSRNSGGTFGSVFRPAQAGGGGHVLEAAFSPQAGAGGGIIRMHAASAIAIDGTLRANGNVVPATGPTGATGAGGSVWITTPGSLTGAGILEARGGDDTQSNYSAGGGGAIAIEYGSASGTLLSHTDVRGGSNQGLRHAASGSVFLRNGSQLGDLRIDNKGLVTNRAVTELPSFGRVNAATVNGATITLDGMRWLDPSLAGHTLRVIAPDGTTRGDIRIESITNTDATPINGFAEIRTQDTTAYDGYLVYSPQGIGGRTFVAARWANDRWEYDTDTIFTAFNPRTGDVIFASFMKDATSITHVATYRCDNICAPIHGLPVRELAYGEFAANSARGAQFWGAATDLGTPDNSEFFLRPDSRGRALLLSNGTNVSITTTPGAVSAGDTLQGIYLFDSIKLTTARVITNDIVESITAPQLDAQSSLDSAGTTIPTIDASRITIERGLHGPVIVGAAGSVTDPESPLDIDTHRATNTTLQWNRNYLMFPGTRGGLSLARRVTSNGGPYTISTFDAITTRGRVAFTPSQSNQEIRAGLGTFSFRLLTDARYELWSNGSYVSGKNGDYTSNTVFRIEKTQSAIRFYVDGMLVHEAIANIPPSLQFEVSIPTSSNAELHSIDYDTTTDAGRFRIAAKPDGSFRLPLRAAGAISLIARDRHRLPLESQSINITIPNDHGIASLAVVPAEVTGGGTTTGTVTLLAPAGSEGALVDITANHAAVIATSVIVAPGATTATFPLATVGVLTATDITITATHGGGTASTILRVVKDDVAPSITITAPSPNTRYTEGQSAKITVQATIVDSDSGVLRADATLDGTTVAMTRNGNVFSADLNVPLIDGAADVTLPIVITAEDNSANIATSNVNVIIQPLVDAQPPAISWSCGSDGAIYAALSTARLRVIATAPNTQNAIQHVSLRIDGTTYAATRITGDTYEVLFATPDVDATFTVRATATTISGSTSFIDASLRILKNASEIATNRTITEFDTTFDNRNVIIREGVTVTIEGAHTFDRLAVFGTLAPSATKPLDVTANAFFVACNATVDATSLGYPINTTHPGARDTTIVQQAASHVGRGGNVTLSGATYGSIERPREFGAGNFRNQSGGGALRINANSVAIDGTMRANGGGVGGGEGAGAGGSIWITATKINGGGTIAADGGNACWAGGGGAIALHYIDASSTLPTLTARPGVSQCGFIGGAGSVFVRSSSSTFGNAIIDSGSNGAGIVELPSLGSGIAKIGSSGAVLVTDRVDNVWPYFVGHWVRITDTNGIVKGTWRIASVNTKTVTLASNAGEPINIVPGDAWQGVYRFDALTLRNSEVRSSDPIEATNETILGTVTTTHIRATTLDVAPSAILTHLPGESLDISVTGDLRIAAGGAIDVTRRGYPINVTYPGARNVTLVQQAASHIGRGGNVTLTGATYGSVITPREAGAGDIRNQPGGGIVRIHANDVLVDGAIRANGGGVGGGEGAGAAGSIWITTSTIAGSGTIEADGGNACWAGGGGAIAIDATNLITLPSLFARGGSTHCGNLAGAGSIYVAGSATFDNTNRGLGITELPSLGNGIAQNGTAGATLVLPFTPPAYLLGREVQIEQKGSWRIAAINGAAVTLTPNDVEMINLAPGDRWRGVQRFDLLKLRSTRLSSLDRIVYNTLDKDAASSLVMNDAAPHFPATPRIVNNVLTGTVVDSDTPIRLTATNRRSGQTFLRDAEANGSFTIPLSGDLGDTFTIVAVDSHIMPLTSATIDVTGQIIDLNHIESLWLEPASILPGGTSIGHVHIADNARPGGVIVALSTSDAAIASVPASVTIPEGITSAQFPIVGGSVGVATITATYGGTRIADLTVAAAVVVELASMTLDSSTVEGGQRVFVNLVLSAPAPNGGAVVSLTSSDSTHVIVPPTITISSGFSDVWLELESTPVEVPTPVTITATYGTTLSVDVTITPCPPLDVVAQVSTLPTTIWFDDDVPAGAIASGAAAFDETQAASGVRALHFPVAEGEQSWSFTGGASRIVGPEHELTLDLLFNRCNPPRQIAITWHGDADYTATWGEQLLDLGESAVHVEQEIWSGDWFRLFVLAKSLGITSEQNITGITIRLFDGEAWFDLAGTRSCVLAEADVVKPEEVDPAEIAWLDDAPPAGAILDMTDDGTNMPWTWSTEHAVSGTRSVYVAPRAGMHRQELLGATEGIAMGDDWLFAYVLVDPCNPPRQIMVEFHDGTSWDHRVFFGEELIDTPDTPATNVGIIPRRGEWTRIDIPSYYVNLPEDAIVTGVRFTLYDGAAWFDKVGKLLMGSARAVPHE